MIKNSHSTAMKKLNNLIRNNNNISLKIPLINNPLQFTTIPFKALISNIEVSEISSVASSTIKTLVCKLNIEELKSISAPTEKYKERNISIVYNKNTYSIIDDRLDAFENTIILYLNKKV